MATLLPSNQEDREVYLREHGAVRFIEMIADAARQSVEVIMTVKAFAEKPQVLYVALEHAYYSGVRVTMTEHPPRSGRVAGWRRSDSAMWSLDLAGVESPRQPAAAHPARPAPSMPPEACPGRERGSQVVPISPPS
jgi:hypothetical protein